VTPSLSPAHWRKRASWEPEREQMAASLRNLLIPDKY
jgi:hypothetical protein